MKNHFIRYKQSDFSDDNIQNKVFEMVAVCVADGTRLIIEQEEIRGERYIMVDFSPTDNSNSEYEYDGQHVCSITSIDNENEGETSQEFVNYFDAAFWISSFVSMGYFSEIYIETY